MSLSGLSESTVNEPHEGGKSIASLVYAGGHLNGYRPPTTRDIPQLRVAPLDAPPSDDEFRSYQSQLKDFSQIEPPPPVPALETVPKIFAQPDFALDNPRVFAQVVGTEDQIDYTILLEKMSWYIDVVELHLLENISNASSSFFRVTSQFNDIQSSAQETHAALTQLKSTIDGILEYTDQEEATLKLVEKLNGLEDLMSHLLQLKDFWIAYSECKQLVESNVPLASEKIAPLKELLHTPNDLSGLDCLKTVIEDMNSFEDRIGSYYRKEVVRELLQDLNTHIDSVPAHDTLLRIGRILHVPGHNVSHNYNNSWTNVKPEFRSRLEGLIKGALEAGVLDTAMEQYRDFITQDIKTLLRENFPTSRSSDPNDNGNALATLIQNLTVVEFKDIVVKLFTQLSEAFRRASTQSKLLLDLCSSMGRPPLIGDLLESLITMTDSRLAKVFKVRREMNSTISVSDYMNIYSLCGIFMSECESICGIYAPELSAYLASQTELYTREFSGSRIKALGTCLDLDIWKKEEVPANFQTTVDLIVESGEQNPVTWLRQWRAVIDGVPEIKESTKKLPQNVFVKDSSYFITRSAVKLVQNLSDLLELVCLLPQTVLSLSHQYIEYFDLFNSKVKALILGTGAMTSGSGLKRITFRHLSLAHESLGFVRAILNFSKGCIQRHLNDPSAFAGSCESLSSKLEHHQKDIEAKFISIMTDKSQSYSRSIGITNWAVSAPGANQYMQNLVKDISTVSRILEDTLNKATAHSVVSKIFDIYKPALLGAYTGLRIQNSAALENVMQDIRYFRDHVKDIKGAGNVGEVLYESMSAFAIPEEEDLPLRAPSPMKTNNEPADVTVGEASELDIPPAPTPSRYRSDKALPATPRSETPALNTPGVSEVPEDSPLKRPHDNGSELKNEDLKVTEKQAPSKEELSKEEPASATLENTEKVETAEKGEEKLTENLSKQSESSVEDAVAPSLEKPVTQPQEPEEPNKAPAELEAQAVAPTDQDEDKALKDEVVNTAEEDTAKPSEDTAKPSKDTAEPSGDAAKPAKPSEDAPSNVPHNATEPKRSEEKSDADLPAEKKLPSEGKASEKTSESASEHVAKESANAGASSESNDTEDAHKEADEIKPQESDSKPTTPAASNGTAGHAKKKNKKKKGKKR